MSKLKVNEIAPFSTTGLVVGGPIVTNPSTLFDLQSTTQGFTPPRMTTVQRDAIVNPATGLCIYNLDTAILEIYGGTGWNNASNSHSRIKNVIRVVKNVPIDGEDFSSIKAALLSITNASPTNEYVVEVGPGIYTEDPFVVPPHVDLIGQGIDNATIQPTNVNAALVTMSENSMISNFTISGVVGATGIAIAFVLLAVSDSTKISRITFGSSTTLIQCLNPLYSCVLHIEDVFSPVSSVFLTGLDIRSTSAPINCVIKSSILRQTTAAAGAVMANISGPSVNFKAFSCNFDYNGGTTGTHLQLSNGASGEALSLECEDGAVGLSVPNTDSAPLIRMAGVEVSESTISLSILHPGTTGFFEGNINMAATVIESTITNLNLFCADPVNHGFVSTGQMRLGRKFSKVTDVLPTIHNASTIGITSGGVLTAGAGLVLNISSGSGYLDDTDNDLKNVTWTSLSPTLPANSTRYIVIDQNGAAQAVTSFDNDSQILLGRVVTNATSIYIIDASVLNSYHYTNNADSLLRNGFGAIYNSGSLVAEFGTRQLQITSGVYYFGTNKFSPSGGSNLFFDTFYQNGVGGWIIGNTNVVDNASYDNGTGALQSLTSSYFAKHALYTVGQGVNEKYLLVYSQAQYANISLAEQGSLPSPPGYFSEGIVLISSIIVQQGVANFSEVPKSQRPILGFVASGISATTYHNNLLNLATGDDHPQYWRNDGTHTATGSFNLGTYNITNVGTVSTLTDVTIPSIAANVISGTSVKTALQQLDFSITNLDQTGHNAWTSGPPVWSSVGGSLTLLATGNGFIKGKYITWAAPQTITIPANTCQLIAIDSTGTIQIYPTPATDIQYQNTIPLLLAMNDGTNILVAKEDHDYSFNTDVTNFFHNNLGTIIQDGGVNVTRVTTGTGASVTDREIMIVGSDYISDSELRTLIPDSGGAGITWNVYYTNGAGHWVRYVQQLQIPMVYDSAGTVTALPTGTGNFGLFTLYVAKDDDNSVSPQYIAVMDNSNYSTLVLAQAAITAGTNAIATNELAGLQIAQIGYAVVRNNATSGYINTLTIAKAGFFSRLVGGGTVGSAALVTLNTSTFANFFNAGDNNVQNAFNDLDAGIVSTNTVNTIVKRDGSGNTAVGVLTATGASITGLTTGSVLFSGTSGVVSQDNAKLFWDDTNFRLGLSTVTPNSTLQVNGSFSVALSTQTASTYAVSATDYVVVIDTTSNSVTVTLPTAVGIKGREYVIKRKVVNANSLTVQTTSSETIDGNLTVGLTNKAALRVVSDNSNWQII
jgi:hypothetical protein